MVPELTLLESGDAHATTVRPTPCTLCYPGTMQAFEARPPPLMTTTDGVIRVVGTRVSLETLVGAFDAGATAEEIVHRYPSLDLRAVYSILSYVLDHRESVDEYIANRKESSRTVQAEVEAQFPPDGIRARLLARRRSSDG